MRHSAAATLGTGKPSIGRKAVRALARQAG